MILGGLSRVSFTEQSSPYLLILLWSQAAQGSKHYVVRQGAMQAQPIRKPNISKFIVVYKTAWDSILYIYSKWRRTFPASFPVWENIPRNWKVGNFLSIFSTPGAMIYSIHSVPLGSISSSLFLRCSFQSHSSQIACSREKLLPDVM